MADIIGKEGGGSFDWKTHAKVGGPGYMVSVWGAENQMAEAPTAADLEAYKANNEALASTVTRPVLGVWGNDDGSHIADISVKARTGKTARVLGKKHTQQAAFALPGTEIRPGVVAGETEGIGKPWGAEVLLHTRDLSKNDSTPGFSKPTHVSHFSNYEVENDAWNEVGGTENGQPVTLGDVLKKINTARTERLRRERGR